MSKPRAGKSKDDDDDDDAGTCLQEANKKELLVMGLDGMKDLQ